MKITKFFNEIWIDCTTTNYSGSAVNLCWDKEKTGLEVYHGVIGTSVRFLKEGIKITVDCLPNCPRENEADKLKISVFEVFKSQLTVFNLLEIIAMNIKSGENNGKKQLQAELRHLLGI